MTAAWLLRIYALTAVMVVVRQAVYWAFGLEHRSALGTLAAALLWPLGLVGIRLR